MWLKVYIIYISWSLRLIILNCISMLSLLYPCYTPEISTNHIFTPPRFLPSKNSAATCNERRCILAKCRTMCQRCSASPLVKRWENEVWIHRKRWFLPWNTGIPVKFLLSISIEYVKSRRCGLKTSFVASWLPEVWVPIASLQIAPSSYTNICPTQRV